MKVYAHTDGEFIDWFTSAPVGTVVEVSNGDELAEWFAAGYRRISVSRGKAVRDTDEVLPDKEPTLEEQVRAMAAQLAAITEYQGVTVRPVGNGVYEVVKRTTGAGTESEPYEYAEGVELIPNAFYEYDDRLWVYMSNSKATATGDFLGDGIWAEW